MRTGEYDGVSASGDATLRLIDGGDVAPVNTDLVPNYADDLPGPEGPALQHASTAQMYGIPHGRGANLLMYNTDDVKPAPDSLGRGLRPEADGGQVQGQDHRLRQPDLHRRRGAVPEGDAARPGDHEPLRAGRGAVRRRGRPAEEAERPNIGEYWSDYTKEIQAFTNGDIDGRHDLAGDQPTSLQADKVAARRERSCPKEGATGWSDTWMISSKAKHPNCMYKWMNYIIDPKINAAGRRVVRRGAGQREGLRRRPPTEALRRSTTPTTRSIWTSVYYWTTPVADCGDDRGDVCKDYDDWVQAWTEIKG